MYSERQKQIIEESIQIINDKGIQGLTIKNLSHAIGISEPAIYRHFDSKKDIMSAILNSFQFEMGEILSKSDESELESAFDVIAMFLNMIFEKLSTNPALVSVIFSEEFFLNEEYLSDKVFEIFKMKESIMIELIRQGQADGEIKKDSDADMLALVILGSLRMLTKKWKMSNYEFNLKDEGKKLILCMNGLLKK
ncbi:MAG: TetR/AcrR family transcriptional regulator [Chlorobi bacterium]|nr:TetR/AcrR family transcriptional regulator [Chlorobiota bacterium]